MTGPDDYARDDLPLVPPSRERLDPPNLPTPPPARGGPRHGMARDRAVVEARRARCVHLRMAGHTYQQIADIVGFTDRKTARDAVMAALDTIVAEGVEELRAIEGAALLQQRRALWPMAMGTPGRPAGVLEDGTIVEAVEPVPPDPEANRVLVRISDRYAKLNGLDAPTKIDLTGNIGEQLGALRAQLAEDGAFTVTGLDAGSPQAVEGPVDAPSDITVQDEPEDPLADVDLPEVTVKREGRMT